jgi:hypothetical protein
MKRKKFMTGSKVTSYQENPGTELAQNSINAAKAKEEAESNPYLTGLQLLGEITMQMGSSAKGSETPLAEKTKAFTQISNFFATGGSVPIEVEGKEVVETPGGQLTKIQGPSHAQGGVDINVPEGTDIYSTRLKGPNGLTMAERKIAREKKISKIEKLLKANPLDAALKTSLQKTLENNTIEEEQDLSIMNIAKTLTSMKQSFAPGGSVMGGKPVLPDWMSSLYDEYLQGSFKNIGEPIKQEDPGEQWNFTNNPPFMAAGNPTVKQNEEQDKEVLKDSKDSMTTGDYLTLGGGLLSSFGPYFNTLKNRSEDTPNVNAFKNFGQDALDSIDKSKEFVQQQEDELIKDIERDRTTAIKQGRNSAMGVNTQRALNMGVDAGVQNAKTKAKAQTAQIMSSILGNQAQFQNMRDQVVMQGEQNKDLADRQDRDNYFTQLAQDIASMGQGIQNTGKNLNTKLENEEIAKILAGLFPNVGYSKEKGVYKK